MGIVKYSDTKVKILNLMFAVGMITLSYWGLYFLKAPPLWCMIVSICFECGLDIIVIEIINHENLIKLDKWMKEVKTESISAYADWDTFIEKKWFVSKDLSVISDATASVSLDLDKDESKSNEKITRIEDLDELSKKRLRFEFEDLLWYCKAGKELIERHPKDTKKINNNVATIRRAIEEIEEKLDIKMNWDVIEVIDWGKIKGVQN